MAVLGTSITVSGQTLSSGNLSNTPFYICPNGSVLGWGANNHGQLADGTKNNRSLPAPVQSLTDISAIATSTNHSLFLKNDGTVLGCGNSSYGQLGTGTMDEYLTPIQIVGLSNVTEVTAGHAHSIFLKSDGTVWRAGSNYDGELANAPSNNNSTPLLIDLVQGAATTTVFYNTSAILENDGSMWTFGNNSSGQLGNGTETGSYTPIKIIDGPSCTSLDIEKLEIQSFKFDVYPNPTNDNIVIETAESILEGKQYSIKIYNSIGTEVYRTASNKEWNMGQATIDVSSLTPGVYIIHLYNGENQSQKKFVKN